MRLIFVPLEQFSYSISYFTLKNKTELQTTVQNAIKREALWRAAAIAVTAKDVLFLPQFLFTNHN